MARNIRFATKMLSRDLRSLESDPGENADDNEEFYWSSWEHVCHVDIQNISDSIRVFTESRITSFRAKIHVSRKYVVSLATGVLILSVHVWILYTGDDAHVIFCTIICSFLMIFTKWSAIWKKCKFMPTLLRHLPKQKWNRLMRAVEVNPNYRLVYETGHNYERDKSIQIWNILVKLFLSFWHYLKIIWSSVYHVEFQRLVFRNIQPDQKFRFKTRLVWFMRGFFIRVSANVFMQCM